MLTIIIYISFGVLPSLIWLFFYLKEDAHPEPNKLVAQVFALGMLAAPVAVGAEYAMLKLYEFLNIKVLFSVLVGIAVIEEILKFLVVRFRVLKDKEFDEPVDAMIYMVISALGFAAVENILFVIQPFQSSLGEGFEVLIARFLGATFLHTLASGIIGFYLALAILHKVKRHTGHLLQGFLIAIAVHLLFNWLIVETQSALVVGIFLLANAIFVSKAFQYLRYKTFPTAETTFQFKTWQKKI